MFRLYDHLQVEIYVLNLVVWILLRVLDQVQGFPSNETLFQQLFTILFKLTATCFGRTIIFRQKKYVLNLVVWILLRVLDQVQGFPSNETI
jgi:hypothetical protein